jgi:nucleoside-diphosphate-sugar epimerase
MTETPLHVVFGAGQIGSRLARNLAGLGLRVRVVRRSNVPAGGAIEVRAGDARDPDFARSAVAGASVIYHCMNPSKYAARTWEKEFPALGEAVIEAALAADARLVVLDNLYGYGEVEGARTEETALAALGRKGLVRARWAERLVVARRQGLRFVVGRAGDFFGPGAEEALLSEQVVAGLLVGKRPFLVGDPAAPHAFSYVPDVVEALTALGRAEADVEGEVFHLPVLVAPTATVLEGLQRALGTDAKPRVAGRGLLRALSPFVPLLGELLETLYQWERPFLVEDMKLRARFPGLGTPLARAIEETALAARRRDHPVLQAA